LCNNKLNDNDKLIKNKNDNSKLNATISRQQELPRFPTLPDSRPEA
jgi:hypothetical protein